MSKFFISSVIIFCFLIANTLAFAQTTTVWNPAGNPESTGLWSEAANWTGGEVPEGDFKVVFNVPDVQACVLDEAHAIKQLVMGDNGDGDTLHVVSSGSLTTGVVWSAIGYNAAATMVVDAGATVTFGEHMWVGLVDGGDGVVVLNGGTINVTQMTGLGWEGGKGTVYVKDGELNLANIHPDNSIKEGSLIDISGGTIYITGDHLAKVEGYIAAGKIIATGETGNVLAYFDADMGKTVVKDGVPPAEARLQVIHNAADPAAALVDIYVNGGLYEDDFAFRDATEFRTVPADVELEIGIAPGNSESAEEVIATFPVTLVKDETYVVFANGVLDPSMFAPNPNEMDISFKLFPVAPGQEMAMDETKVEFFAFHGVTDAPAVDVIARDVATLVDNAAYGDATPYIPVPPGVYILDITPAEANDVVVASFKADLSGLAGGAAAVFASGFLDPTANSDGAAFGLFAALPTGDVVAFPVADETLVDITDLGGFIKGSNDHLPWTGPNSDGSPDNERIAKLIDNNDSTKYLVGAEQSWIDYYTNINSRVEYYTLTSANDAPDRDPNTWQLQGWDAATVSWVTIDSVVNQPVWEERYQKKTFEVEGAGYYNKYRLNITAINGNAEGLMQIAELEIYAELGDEVNPDITDLDGLIKGSNDDSTWTGPNSNGSPDSEKIPNLIDNDINTKYLVGAEESWIDYYTTTMSKVTSYTLTSANDAPERDPNTWLFQGWDTATATWVTLDSVVNQPAWEERFQTKTFAFDNEDLYFNKYRLHILTINGDTQGLMQFAELQIFGELGEQVPADVTDYADMIKGSNDHLPWTGPNSDGSPDAEKIPKLIDNDINTKYLVGAEQSWIDLFTPRLSKVSGYSITSANDAPGRDPNSWILHGWDAETATWVALDSVVDQPEWEERFQTKMFEFDNTDLMFNKYRLQITAINGDADGLMQMAEFQLFGELGDKVPADITDYAVGIEGSNDALPWTGPNSDGSPDNERIERLIDNDKNTKYLVGAEQSWINLYTDRLSKVTGYSLTSANDDSTRDPNSWELQGWDTENGEWVRIHRVNNQSAWEERFLTKSWTVSTANMFSTYRLDITAINGDDEGLMQIAELQIFGELGQKVDVVYPPTSVDSKATTVTDFALNQNYPNPFNPITTISFTLPKNAQVKLTVFDILGRRVTTLVDEKMSAGLHNVTFDGAQYASGVYFYHLKAGDRIFQKKMMLVK